jgi:hypothetical protein
MTEPLALNIGDTVQTIVDKSANIGLKVLTLLVIMLIGWFIARILRKVAHRLLTRVGADRMAAMGRRDGEASEGGLNRLTGQFKPSDLLAKLIYYAVLLFTVQLAFSVFGPNPVSDMIHSVVAWLPKAFVACIIVIVAVAIASAVFDLISSALGGLSYGRMLGRAAQVAILALGIIAALNQIGVATAVTLPVLITVLATIGGIAIVGVGGGLIAPMRLRWERMLDRAEAEGGRVATHLRENAAADSDRPSAGAGFGQPSYSSPTERAAHNIQPPTSQPTTSPVTSPTSSPVPPTTSPKSR